MSAQRLLIVLGLVILVVGLAWPWLMRLAIGRLPGDILVRRGGFTFYAPLMTGLIASAVLTLVLWLLRR
jgi:hypothetical protein